MKVMAIIMQRVSSVLNKVYGLAILIIFLNCSTPKRISNKIENCEECYTIERFKMRADNSTKSILLFNYYEFSTKEALPFDFVIIDDFAFKENPVEIMTTDGVINIIVSKHSKKPVKIEHVSIAKGDSLVVNVYLKEFNAVFNQ
jgi:hypothetical protein